jgi:hypothetical protein
MICSVFPKKNAIKAVPQAKKTVKPKRNREEERFIDWRVRKCKLTPIVSVKKERQQKDQQPERSIGRQYTTCLSGLKMPRRVEQQEALRREQEREEYLKPIPFKAEILPITVRVHSFRMNTTVSAICGIWTAYNLYSTTGTNRNTGEESALSTSK